MISHQGLLGEGRAQLGSGPMASGCGVQLSSENCAAESSPRWELPQQMGTLSAYTKYVCRNLAIIGACVRPHDGGGRNFGCGRRFWLRCRQPQPSHRPETAGRKRSHCCTTPSPPLIVGYPPTSLRSWSAKASVLSEEDPNLNLVLRKRVKFFFLPRHVWY